MDEARRPGVHVVLVYTREIHPNEQLPYGRFSHHETFDEKLAAARGLQRAMRLRMTVAVDDLEGTTHRAYGCLPFSAVIIDRGGIVVHRQEWAGAEQLSQVLQNLRWADHRRSRGRAPRPSFSETLWRMERLDSKP
jgi:hypothetical protein